jgi:hypothetical protein
VAIRQILGICIKSKNSLNAHQSTDSFFQYLIFSCQLLQNGARIPSPTMKYNCGHCSESFEARHLVLQHLSEMHRHKCNFCQVHFSSKELLDEHSTRCCKVDEKVTAENGMTSIPLPQRTDISGKAYLHSKIPMRTWERTNPLCCMYVCMYVCAVLLTT